MPPAGRRQRVSDPELRAIQKQAVLSFYHRQTSSEPRQDTEPEQPCKTEQQGAGRAHAIKPAPARLATSKWPPEMTIHAEAVGDATHRRDTKGPSPYAREEILPWTALPQIQARNAAAAEHQHGGPHQCGGKHKNCSPEAEAGMQARDRRSPRKAQLSEVRHPDPARPAELRVITPEGVTVLGGPPSPPQLPPRATGRPSPPPVPPSRRPPPPPTTAEPENSPLQSTPEDTEVAGLPVQVAPAAGTSCSGCPSPDLPLPPPPPLDPLANEMTPSDEPLPPPPPDLTALVDAALAQHTTAHKVTVYPKNSYMSFVSVRKPCRRHGYDGNYRRVQNASPPCRELDSPPGETEGSTSQTPACPFCQLGPRAEPDSPTSQQTVMCQGPECDPTRTLSNQVQESRTVLESRVEQESRPVQDSRHVQESKVVQESRVAQESRPPQNSRPPQEQTRASREVQDQKNKSKSRTELSLDNTSHLLNNINNNGSVQNRYSNNNNNCVVNSVFSKTQLNRANSQHQGESRVWLPQPDSYIVLPIDLGEPTKDAVPSSSPPQVGASQKQEAAPDPLRKWEGSTDQELDRLSRSFAERCGDQVLKSILVPGPDRVQLWDYMEGVFSRDELMSRSKEVPRTSRQAPNQQEGTSTINNNNSPESDRNCARGGLTAGCGGGAELPPHSAYFTTSEPKAKLLARLSQTDMLNGETCAASDSSELGRKKEELITSISRKLSLLRSEQLGLQEEVSQNEKLGREVACRVEAAAKPNELQKYRLHVEETEKILNLLMSLSGRLARAQNALRALPTDADPDERRLLEAKRDKLSSQHEEARTLKESLDRRGRQVDTFLETYLSEEEFGDYLHFVAMKAKLLVDARELDEKIRLGEEQLAALERRTRPQDVPGRSPDWSRTTGSTSV